MRLPQRIKKQRHQTADYIGGEKEKERRRARRVCSFHSPRAISSKAQHCHKPKDAGEPADVMQKCERQQCHSSAEQKTAEQRDANRAFHLRSA